MLERVAVGDLPAKHHIAFKSSDGELRHEECFTRAGFDGPYSILYHRYRPHTHRPSTVEHSFALPDPAPELELAKRHFKSFDLPRRGGAPIDTRTPLIFNDDVVLGVLHPDAPDPVFFVNADADDLMYIFEGGGELVSPFGVLRFNAGDYVCVPRGVPHRYVPSSDKQYWLSIECFGPVAIPKQWRNEAGQLRMDAPYCHRDFRRPEFSGPTDDDMRGMVLKRDGAFHGFEYQTTPLDVVGWDGTVYPWAFPILNFQARAGLVHLPPTWHGTFAAPGSLICSFVPRVTDFHPDAIPCPYPHSSVDVDEFLFYCKGNFTSRKGIAPGSISLHPAGIPHGPHPGAYEGSIGSSRTDEMAVMLDCFKPLRPTLQAMAIEDPAYMDSFG